MRKLFTKILTPPAYLTMPSVGIDISDSFIRFVEFKEDKFGQKKLDRFGQKTIEEGIISNGKVLQKEKFIKILESFKREYKLTFVRTSIPQEYVYLFSVKIPKVKKDFIRKTVKKLIEKRIPLPINKIVFDYQIVNELESHYTIEVTVVSSEIVEDYALLFKKAGLVLVGFELESQATARAVIKSGDTHTYMIVNYGSTRTELSFVVNGIVCFTSFVKLGNSMQDKELAQVLSMDSKIIKELKKKNGLSKNNKNEQFYQAVLTEVELLRDVINKHFIFWHTHKDEFGATHPTVHKILLCGDHAHLVGLPEYLSATLRVSVVCADPWINITDRTTYIPKIERDVALSYCASIGLSLTNMDSLVNVLPQSSYKKIKKIVFFRVSIIFILLSVLFFVIASVVMLSIYVIQKKQFPLLQAKNSLQNNLIVD